MYFRNTKHMFMNHIFLIFLLLRCSISVYGVDVEVEQDLYHNASLRLFNYVFDPTKYQSKLSPVYSKYTTSTNGSAITGLPRFKVEVIITYAKIMRIDEAEQLFTLSSHFLFKWKDTRLRWNPSDFEDIQHLYVHRDQVWIPENNLYDVRDYQDLYPDYKSYVGIEPDGTVTMNHEFYTEVTCRVDLSRFPFDSQECSLHFIVYTFPHFMVSMEGSIRQWDYASETSNGEWLVTNVTVAQTFEGVKEFMFDDLGFTYHIKRYPHFYLYVIALPCFLLTVLSIIGMFWTPNVKEEQISKLSIGLTSLMSMTVLLDMVSQQIPKTPTFPLLGIYVIICVVIVAVACCVLVTFTTKEITDRPLKKHWMFFIRRKIFSINFGLLIFFQTMNIINTVIFISYWK